MKGSSYRKPAGSLERNFSAYINIFYSSIPIAVRSGAKFGIGKELVSFETIWLLMTLSEKAHEISYSGLSKS